MSLSPETSDVEDTPATSPNTAGHIVEAGTRTKTLPEGGVVVATDEENTRHIIVCAQGGKTRIDGKATAIRFQSGKTCPAFAKTLTPGVHARYSGYGMPVIARRAKGWWHLALWDRRGAGTPRCAECRSQACARKVKAKATWLRVLPSGSLRTFNPTPVSGHIDDWVAAARTAKKTGVPPPAEMLWRLDAIKVKEALEGIAPSSA